MSEYLFWVAQNGIHTSFSRNNRRVTLCCDIIWSSVFDNIQFYLYKAAYKMAFHVWYQINIILYENY